MVAAGGRLHQSGVEGLQEASRLSMLFERQRGLVSRAPAETNLQSQRAYRVEFDLLNAEIDDARQQVQNLAPIGARPQVENLTALFSEWRLDAAKVFDLAANFVQDQATDELNGPLTEIAKRIDTELQTILKTMREHARGEADRLASTGVSLLLEIAAVSSTALAVLLASGIMLTRSISGRLRRITTAMTAISTGTGREIEIPSTRDRDEVGEMARALEVFRSNVEEIGKLRVEQGESERRAEFDRHATVVRLSREIEAGVKASVGVLLQAAEKMQQSATGMSTAVNETIGQTAFVLSASQQASSSSLAIAAAAEEMSGSVSGLVDQLVHTARYSRQEAENAAHTTAVIEGLHRGAEKIGEVVGLIQSIAEQTNLLALNATIEAARAGEAGRGFAVVAAEVKDLAGQTAKATATISAQITEIQAATGAAVAAVRQIQGAIADIDARTSTVATAIEQHKAATSEISERAGHAAAKTHSASESVRRISGTNDTASRLASAVSTAASDVAGQARGPQREVQKFLQKVHAT
jgi:methyl-accepting chemotaxis protein